VLTGIVSYDKLKRLRSDRGRDRCDRLTWLFAVHQACIIMGLSSVILVMMLAQPRIFYAMARDGLLPAGRRQGAPAVSYPHHHDRDRNGGDDPSPVYCRSVWSANWSDRHLVRLHHRVRLACWLPHYRAAAAPPVQDAGGLLSSRRWRAVGRLPDERTAARHWRARGLALIGLGIYVLYGARHSRVQAAATTQSRRNLRPRSCRLAGAASSDRKCRWIRSLSARGAAHAVPIWFVTAATYPDVRP